MSELGRFQDAFAQALVGDFAPLDRWTTAGAEAQARFSVYRNTVAKGLADALADQFPTVARAVGEGWMREAALRFAAEHPPRSPALMAYGEEFPDWLGRFPPAAGMPWLTALARIDWARRDSLFAADAEPLGAAAFAELAAKDYPAAAVELHPSVAVLWFDHGAPELWRALQADPPPAAVELPPDPQGLLLVRPRWEVLASPLAAGGFAFLQACRAGETLAAAGEAAISAEPDVPLAAFFAEMIALGAFVRIRRSPDAVG